MARVIVSAGHTSNDTGAIYQNLREVDFTRKIAEKVYKELKAKNIETLAVPYELELIQRIDWINATGYNEKLGDICIEIHINDGGKTGIEGWFKGPGENLSQTLTDYIIDSVVKKTGLINQGIKNEFDHPLKSLAFLNRTNPISSLLECLYLDNEHDQLFLKNDQKLDLLAEGICDGIINFINRSQEQKDNLKKSIIPTTTLIKPDAVNVQSQTPSTPVTNISPVPISIPSPTISTFPTPQAISPIVSSQLGSQPSGYTGIQNISQERENRRKMIVDTYQMILNRAPNQNDLNYFLNINITQDQLIKRMVESQEHADIVKAGRESNELKAKFESLEQEALKARTDEKDKEQIIENLNNLIAQKNEMIARLEQQVPGLKTNVGNGAIVRKTSETTYKPTLSERILGFFNKVFD